MAATLHVKRSWPTKAESEERIEYVKNDPDLPVTPLALREPIEPKAQSEVVAIARSYRHVGMNDAMGFAKGSAHPTDCVSIEHRRRNCHNEFKLRHIRPVRARIGRRIRAFNENCRN
jgi:hypothetical protein